MIYVFDTTVTSPPREGELVGTQPQRIKSGLKETVMKSYIVERTLKSEIRSEEQREKAKRNQIQLK